MSKRRFILIRNGKIYLTPNDSFGIENTSFPPDSLAFKSNVSTYLEVAGGYTNEELLLRIINYNPSDISPFNSQSLTTVIRLIRFENLDWQKFEKLLGSFRLNALKPFLDPLTINTPTRTTTFPKVSMPDFVIVPEQIEAFKTREQTYNEEFEVSYKDAEFCNGYVEFYKTFSWSNTLIRFKIENPFIIAEFNLIKDYFAKVINGRKRFTVQIQATKKGLEIIDHKATSADISKVNTAIIESINIDRTKRLFNTTRKNNSNKATFTTDEIYAQLDEKANIFNQSEIDILNIIVDTYGRRNKRPLKYLSEKKQSNKQKLRFTLKPMFGFLFFIEGNNRDYFCWELLDSHATYLWAVERNSDTNRTLIATIETQIAIIQEKGREQYRREIKEAGNQELSFLFIDHKGIKLDEEEGFKEWKLKFDEKVT